ncbi:glutamine amidotransferase [Listeria weihenstephanensis]|uniref:Glutamine amidotransferase n=1 Tax=Listeria weihenstephanensis TaxID=1006155 RepID=A0A841ZA65_9LIST|nr:type 1 glutamine amidotransferase family protein [Listeria weihenstephanensis]MBC1502058.1 glutamine amidotransferase [Listeria weihenstephanensis]
MQEVLFVLLDRYADWEAASLAAVLNSKPDDTEQKYCVKTVGLTKDGVRSIGGFTTLPDYTLDTAPSEFAGIILIGGESWRNPEAELVLPLLNRAVVQNALIAAICDATTFLGKNGLLNEAKHTSNGLTVLQEWAKENYTGAPLYLEEEAVREGNLVTANGTAFLEFAREVMLGLKAAPDAEVLEWYDFYKLGYYEAMKKMHK